MPRRLYSKWRRQYDAETIKPAANIMLLSNAIKAAGAETRVSGTLHDLFSNFMGHKKVGRGVAPATVPYAHHPERANKDTVVIIGAGLAGLSCAYELLKSRHFNVVIIEAKDRVGGRVWTVHQDHFDISIEASKHSERTVERGGELIGLNHFFWLNYLDEFGLHLDVLDTSEEEIHASTELNESEICYKYMKLIFDELDAEAAKIPLYDADGAEAKGSRPWHIPQAEIWDNISLGSYLDDLKPKFFSMTENELRARKFDFKNLGRFDKKMFAKVIDMTKADFENNNGTSCETQSLYFNLITIANGNRKISKEFLSRLADNVNLKDKDARTLSFWDDSELFRCAEGNGALAMKFKEHIEKMGGKIMLNTEVHSVRIKDGSVKITVKDSANEITPFKIPGSKFHKVVSAVPPSVWHKIKFEPELPKNITPQMGYLVKYLFNVPADVTEEFRTLTDSTYTQWAMVWEGAMNQIPSDEAEKEKVVNTLALFAGGCHAKIIAKLPTPEARREYIFHNINMMRPDTDKRLFTPDSIIEDVWMDWPKDSHVMGGYACPAVGEVTTVGPFIHSCVKDKLYFAGEFACRYKWVGFMEGALISGAGVAKEILKPFKKFVHEQNTATN